MKLNIALSALFFGAQSSASASDTGVLLVHGPIKKRHLATNETYSRSEQRQERLEKLREEWAKGKGEFHHGGNHTNGRINNVTLAQAQVVQPSLAKEEEGDPLFGCPQEDIVHCDNGLLVEGGGVTCKDACGVDCCDYYGADACDGFTGRVCKDGYSCNGKEACKDADIDLVVGGCRGKEACEYADIKRGVIRGCISEESCKNAGSSDGHVGRIKDGCVGFEACNYLGNGGGYVGFVDNGCVGEDSCKFAAEVGHVGFIRNACKGDGTFFGVCQGAGRGGFVGFIENSCTGTDACKYVGSNTPGGIGSIEHSCHDDYACSRAGSSGGNITSIKWSCKGEDSCYQAAAGYGFINGINKACLGDSACFQAAKYGGSINGISKACLTDSSCFYAARGSDFFAGDGGSIDSGIKNCVCDTCAGALDDASLPNECGDKLDFGELFEELNDIIKSKIDP